jgi:hypothetical protein
MILTLTCLTAVKCSWKAHVLFVEEIGNVSICEHFTWEQSEEERLGHSRVGAAYPEDLGTLGNSKGWEQVGIIGLDALGPAPVHPLLILLRMKAFLCL